MTTTDKERRFLAAISTLPRGGLVDEYEEDGEIVAICWRWTEGKEKIIGWFDLEGNPIEPPKNKE
jgi:hypothetical protein